VAEPCFVQDTATAPAQAHDPEKWEPVFGNNHAPSKQIKMTIQRDDVIVKSAASAPA
jgi:hypothetical protein